MKILFSDIIKIKITFINYILKRVINVMCQMNNVVKHLFWKEGSNII